MKTALNCLLLTSALGLALAVPNAEAAVAIHVVHGNPVNFCQAFTPGPANTIRNRVVGSENIGATIAVACNFAHMTNGAAGTQLPYRLSLWFSNNTSSPITITCTMLTGLQGDNGAYAVTKSVNVAANGQRSGNIAWTQADNPTAGATTLGDDLIGANCTLPTGGVINDTYFYWNMDNGV